MVGDILINIGLYVPFGISAFALLRHYRRNAIAWVAPVLAAVALSCSIEMIQLFEPARHCSALDVICNALGAGLGTFGGWLFEELSAVRSTGTTARPVRRLAFVDRAALALLFCWGAYLVFPFFPVLGRTMTRQKIGLFLHSGFSPVSLASATACWFVAGGLLMASGMRPIRTYLVAALFAIPAQILIVFRQPAFVEMFGAGLGIALFLLWSRRVPAGLTAAAFLLLLVVRGLAPFHFEHNPIEFSWLPFGGLLAMDWRPGMVVLLEKLFYYGAAIWLLRVSGVRLVFGAPIVALVLAAIEVAQIRIPGRTPEITDPLLAILMGLVLGACQPKAHPRGALPVEVLP